MNQFSAQLFVNIGASIKWMEDVLNVEGSSKKHEDGRRKTCVNFGIRLADMLDSIGCNLSAKAARRLSADSSRLNADGMRARAQELRNQVFDEMSSHLFFWVPAERANFYGKTGRSLLGDQCVERFAKSDIANEAEQASKCFAFGQYTACVFHLMRICEAGVRALALAIGYQWEASPNWGKFFKQYDAQLATNPTKHVEPWISHAQFLEAAGGNLRAVKDAWRNDTMHLDKSYDEDQAKHLLAVVPAFMRHIATTLDEEGVLY